jgi:tryptophanyl-tRNA synthetase
MKKQLAEDMVNFIRPIREKAADIQHNQPLLDKIIKTGAEKARASAAATLNGVRKAIRINY